MPKKSPGQGKPVRKKEDSWLSEDVKASTGLPPQVYGQVRCFCKLSVSQVVWTIPKPPDLVLVRVKWWGEEGDGVLFRPFDVKKGNKTECRTTARYPVRSGPCQFATYLIDMGSLTLDMMTGPNSEVIGQATITQIGLLANSRPINGFFPVISPSGQKLANLQVSIVLEPLLASYDNLGTIPTTDAGMENGRSYDSMVMPVNSHPMPYSDLPTRPENTVFISPSSVNDDRKGQAEVGKMYFDGGLRQQLDYGLPDVSANGRYQLHPERGAVAITTNGDVVSLPESRAIGSGGGLTASEAVNSSSARNRGFKSPVRSTGSVDKDILSVLVEKGTKLREAMIVSSMHMDVNSNQSTTKASTVKTNNFVFNPLANATESAALTDDFDRPSKSAVDVLLTSPVRNQDFQLYNLLNGLSPGSSVSSDMEYDQMMSDLEDPMHENSILHELFYHNSDNEVLGFSDVSGYDKNHHQNHHQSPDNHYMSLPARLPGGSGGHNPLEAAGNQRPPSRASSLTSLNMAEDEEGMGKKKKKTKRTARSRSRSSSRSQTRSRSNTPRRSKNPKKSGMKDTNSDILKDPKPVKLTKKSRSRSNSRSRSRSRPRRRKQSVESDSDRLSSAYSEKSKDVNKLQQDGLSVERLTLLGRVHVARVNIDSLQLLRTDLLDTSDTKLSVSKFKTGKPPRPQRTKKLCTYFVEYQFPVVAASRDKYTPNAVATEVTRIASKNIKDGAVIFNHRSVFPILFDGAAVERWWKSALVFRLYCREAGQQTPVLIGSGGMSLKSVLRSDNLFVQREIEIIDTSKNGQHNYSQASSLNSSVSGRSSGSVFGCLKVSVELASDHKEFPTIMARTKLAEMGENVKIVPIGGIPPEKARLVEQLNKNRDQPVTKSPAKKIDIPGTESQSLTTTAITGLPPQSPRRKAAESSEERDGISKLKQQLKATLAVLNNPSSQKLPVGSHMDAGAHMLGGQRDIEPTTLYTLLHIQEGRNITLYGVPPLHMANKYPGLLRTHSESAGRDSVTRNTYLVCRMFWTSDAVHSDVCWGTLNPEYNFLQIAPLLMTTTLLERLRDNYMIVEVWDKKVSSENDKLIGMVKLSLHQFYLSFRDRKIANALFKSEYPVMAIDNYVPIVDPFSGLHFGQLKVVLAMGSEPQIINLQRLALGSAAGTEAASLKPSSYLERQDLLKEGGSLDVSGKTVEHQFEIVVEGLRGLKLFENMIWGEADCFVQFFFPAEGDKGEDGTASVKSIPTMKCFRTATTLCIPDPTFHDISRHKLTLPLGVPVQRELLTACANSGEGVTGLPFEIWCRYYHPNVRDQLIAKCTLPLAKLCAMITMHKSNEPCVQSFSLRLSQVGVAGHEHDAETAAKSKDAGVLDVTVNYKCQPAVSQSTLMAASRNHAGSLVCLSVGIIRAAGLKAAADSIAQLDSSMAYPADVGVNAYARIKIPFLGKENERVTKTVARSFAPEFSHWMDFPCPLLMSQVTASDATSLAELLESAEAVFEVWHQIPTGLNKDFYTDKNKTDIVTRKLAHQTGDVLLGTAVVPLASLLSRRTGIHGWFPISLPSLGWTKPVGDNDVRDNAALDQVVGGLELLLKFAHQEDRDRVVSVGRSVGWSPMNVDVEQPDWQDEDSHNNVHNITVSVEQVSVPAANAVITGQVDLDPLARCYIRYKFYDKGAVVSKSRKMHASDGSLHCSLDHKHNFMLPHTGPLQWYLQEERLEIQVWLTYGHGRDSEKKPRKRDKLIGSCYIDLESLIDMRRRCQRISGLFPLFKPGASSLKAAFVKAHIISKVSSSAKDQTSENEKAISESEVSVSASETDQSSDVYHQSSKDFTINKSPRKRKADRQDPEASFGVVLAVDRAMHLPMVTDRNRSGEISPTTYVSFQSSERSKPTCSSIFPNSVNPVWDFTVETRLSTEYLYKENKNLVLKVWHKPSEAPKAPDKSCDRVLGFVSVDLSSLTKGLQQICGWYNIMDFNGQCKGQIKVSITPLDLQSVLPTGSTGNSSLWLPPFIPYASTSENTRAVASTIAQQLVSLQQQVMQRMGALSSQSVAASVTDTTTTVSAAKDVDAVKDLTIKDPVSEAVTTFHWQPKFMPETRTDDSSKSYLFSSLQRQLQDLDTITQRLKNRLTTSTQTEDAAQSRMNKSHSGDILTGTQSDLSTIHTASMLMNTRESSEPSPYAFSFEVGTSQESARSHTMNNSSGVENDADSVRMKEDTSGSQGHRLLDSGVFSARNFSEKSGDIVVAGHCTEKNEKAISTNSNLSALPSVGTLPHGVTAVGTLEARFLSLAVTNPQTLHSTVENSESSGNSHGFVPHAQRSNTTEKSVRDLGHRRSESDDKTSSSAGGAGNRSEHIHSNNGSSSARSNENKIEEKDEVEDYVSDNEDEDGEEHKSGRYGNYHRYREMLDAEETERDGDVEEDDAADKAEVIEIVPRSLNNMSTVLALSASKNLESSKIRDDNFLRPAAAGNKDGSSAGYKLDNLAFSPPSPNVNALEGTSVWCSEDNDDSFFQLVFEKNKHLLGRAGENLDEITVDDWMLDQSNDVGKARLESWLEVHSMGRSRKLVEDGASFNQFEQAVMGNVSDGQEAMLKHKNSGRANYLIKDLEDTDDEITPREEKVPGISEEVTKLHLESDSEHNSEDSLREKGNLWNQSAGNSSTEETPRNFWAKKQSMADHFSDHEDEINSKLKDFHVQTTEEEGIDKERNRVTDIPSCDSKSLLSNVELQESVTFLPRKGQSAHSVAQIDQNMHPSTVGKNTLESAFGRVSLPSDQAENHELPLTSESAEVHPHNEYIAQGARPKVRNQLSEVDLVSASSPRPHSGTSHESKTSAHSQKSQDSQGSKASLKSKTNSSDCRENSDKASKASQRNAVSEKSGEQKSVTSAGSSNVSSSKQRFTSNDNEELAHSISVSENRNNSNVLIQASSVTTSKPGQNDRDSTVDSAYIDGDCSDIPSTHPNSLVMVNGMHPSAEDSGLGHARDVINRNHTLEESSGYLPNFFMSEKDMQASIRALKMATAAAKMNKEKLRSENKVKAVSELVNKIASSKSKALALSVKNKQPPSAEEAKRIAKIFTSKMP